MPDRYDDPLMGVHRCAELEHAQRTVDAQIAWPSNARWICVTRIAPGRSEWTLTLSGHSTVTTTVRFCPFCGKAADA